MAHFDVTSIGPIALDDGELVPETAFTVLGPCPGCWVWTLEYWREDVAVWSQFEFNQVIEDLLAEHLQECSGLREVLAASS